MAGKVSVFTQENCKVCMNIISQHPYNLQEGFRLAALRLGTSSKSVSVSYYAYTLKRFREQQLYLGVFSESTAFTNGKNAIRTNISTNSAISCFRDSHVGKIKRSNILGFFRSLVRFRRS